MNLIEAWKKAKEGQKIYRKSHELDWKWPRPKQLKECFNLLSEGELMADDWEVEKIKRRCEENWWTRDEIGGRTWTIPSHIPNHTCIHITWEWEE